MAEKNEYLGKAYERLNQISADEERWMEYLAWERAILDHNYLMGENLRRGLEAGRAEGECLKLISQVRKKNSKGISAEACAEMLEESPDTIRKMYQMLEEHPDWEDFKIYEELSGTSDNMVAGGDSVIGFSVHTRSDEQDGVINII